MGTTTISAPEYELTFFTARSGEPPTTQVTAVVIRRGRRDAVRPYHRAFWPALWRALRPPRRPEPGDRPPWTVPPEWDGASDGGGPHEVLHSRRRRVVRVAGQEHALPPDDRTLVLLVAPDGGSAAGPRITAHAIAVAREPIPRLDRNLPKQAMLGLLHEHHTRVRQRLERALAADPVVQAFMQRGQMPEPPAGSLEPTGA